MDQSVGTILRQKREEKRFTLDQVYQGTNIRLVYLQAIENDLLDQIPSRAQARGFIRLYASFLGLDPFVLLDLLQPKVPTPPDSQPLPDEPPEIENENTNEESLLQQGKSSLKQNLKRASERLQETYQNISDKIPFKIVKKGEPAIPSEPQLIEPAPQSDSARPAKNQNNYQSMCKAIGENLRKKRESLGLSLVDVERQIRIREAYLYALEAGNFDDLPSTVQGRGMLGNYAAFLGLDSESFLSRFAEALQQKRLEALPEEKKGIPLPVSPEKKSVTGWRRLFSPDLIFTGGMFLVFFVFIIWGAVQLIGINSTSIEPTVIPISDLLLSSGTPGSSDQVTLEGGTPQFTPSADSGFTPIDNLDAALAASSSGPIQLIVVAHHRAFMKITVDGKDAFVNRVVPGTIYSYTGKNIITLLTGDGSALEVYYNQTDLGILGSSSEVISMQFTTKGSLDLGAQNTPTPTPSQIPSLTPLPTATPTTTSSISTPTLYP
ncbi:MAG: helix-turn-helix domain-containing protein [Anaerolineaceae bacterium]